MSKKVIGATLIIIVLVLGVVEQVNEQRRGWLGGPPQLGPGLVLCFSLKKCCSPVVSLSVSFWILRVLFLLLAQHRVDHARVELVLFVHLPQFLGLVLGGG